MIFHALIQAARLRLNHSWICSNIWLVSILIGCRPVPLLVVRIMDLATPSFMDRPRGLARARAEEMEDEASETGEKPSKSPRKEEEATSQRDRGRRLPASGSSAGGGSSGGKGSRGGKGHKARNSRGYRVEELEPMDRLALQTAELNLESKVENRESKGYQEKTILAPLEHAMVQAGLDEAKLVNEDRQAPANRGKNLGSGHVRIFGKAFMALSQTPEALEHEELKAALTKFWAEIFTTKSEDIVREQVQTFKVIRPKITSRVKVGDQALGDYARVVIRMKPSTRKCSAAEDLQEAFVNFAREQSWAVLVGTPPRTKKERDLSDTLNEIKQQLRG